MKTQIKRSLKKKSVISFRKKKNFNKLKKLYDGMKKSEDLIKYEKKKTNSYFKPACLLIKKDRFNLYKVKDTDEYKVENVIIKYILHLKETKDVFFLYTIRDNFYFLNLKKTENEVDFKKFENITSQIKNCFFYEHDSHILVNFKKTKNFLKFNFLQKSIVDGSKNKKNIVELYKTETEFLVRINNKYYSLYKADIPSEYLKKKIKKLVPINLQYIKNFKKMERINYKNYEYNENDKYTNKSGQTFHGSLTVYFDNNDKGIYYFDDNKNTRMIFNEEIQENDTDIVEIYETGTVFLVRINDKYFSLHKGDVEAEYRKKKIKKLVPVNLNSIKNFYEKKLLKYKNYIFNENDIFTNSISQTFKGSLTFYFDNGDKGIYFFENSKDIPFKKHRLTSSPKPKPKQNIVQIFATDDVFIVRINNNYFSLHKADVEKEYRKKKIKKLVPIYLNSIKNFDKKKLIDYEDYDYNKNYFYKNSINQIFRGAITFYFDNGDKGIYVFEEQDNWKYFNNDPDIEVKVIETNKKDSNSILKEKEPLWNEIFINKPYYFDFFEKSYVIINGKYFLINKNTQKLSFDKDFKLPENSPGIKFKIIEKYYFEISEKLLVLLLEGEIQRYIFEDVNMFDLNDFKKYDEDILAQSLKLPLLKKDISHFTRCIIDENNDKFLEMQYDFKYKDNDKVKTIKVLKYFYLREVSNVEYDYMLLREKFTQSEIIVRENNKSESNTNITKYYADDKKNEKKELKFISCEFIEYGEVNNIKNSFIFIKFQEGHTLKILCDCYNDNDKGYPICVPLIKKIETLSDKTRSKFWDNCYMKFPHRVVEILQERNDTGIISAKVLTILSLLGVLYNYFPVSAIYEYLMNMFKQIFPKQTGIEIINSLSTVILTFFNEKNSFRNDYGMDEEPTTREDEILIKNLIDDQLKFSSLKVLQNVSSKPLIKTAKFNLPIQYANFGHKIFQSIPSQPFIDFQKSVLKKPINKVFKELQDKTNDPIQVQQFDEIISDIIDENKTKIEENVKVEEILEEDTSILGKYFLDVFENISESIVPALKSAGENVLEHTVATILTGDVFEGAKLVERNRQRIANEKDTTKVDTTKVDTTKVDIDNPIITDPYNVSELNKETIKTESLPKVETLPETIKETKFLSNTENNLHDLGERLINLTNLNYIEGAAGEAQFYDVPFESQFFIESAQPVTASNVLVIESSTKINDINNSNNLVVVSALITASAIIFRFLKKTQTQKRKQKFKFNESTKVQYVTVNDNDEIIQSVTEKSTLKKEDGRRKTLKKRKSLKKSSKKRKSLKKRKPLKKSSKKRK
jgi:hypothetical protein